MTNDLFALTGRRVLVTGGTRGIGRAISIRLAQAGAHVLANYVRNDEAAVSLQKDMQALGANLEICRSDVSAPNGIQRLADTLGPAPLSAVVHSAATGVHGAIE